MLEEYNWNIMLNQSKANLCASMRQHDETLKICQSTCCQKVENQRNSKQFNDFNLTWTM